MTAKPRRTKPTNSRVRFAPIRRQAASGGPRAAGSGRGGGAGRPRRRGRRGGRRRRGGPEDGLVGSIADELGPTSVPEATSAVADFDGIPSEPSLPVVQPESIAPPPDPQ